MCGKAVFHMYGKRISEIISGEILCWRNVEVACMLYFWPFFSLDTRGTVVCFHNRVAWKIARFHARVLQIIFMNADKSHIFREVSGKIIETVRSVDNKQPCF